MKNKIEKLQQILERVILKRNENKIKQINEEVAFLIYYYRDGASEEDKAFIHPKDFDVAKNWYKIPEWERDDYWFCAGKILEYLKKEE